MDTCVIFCAGGFRRLARQPEASDCILAADGGLTHVRALGLEPGYILGDFDSLGYVPQGARVFPMEKDDTDSMLAVRLGLELGYRRFELYGALDGDRLDHTLANLQALCFLADRGAQGWLVGEKYLVTAVKNRRLLFPRGARGTVSVFCLGEPARGVTLEGLKYPLHRGTLTAGFPLGVSNRFLPVPATLTVEQGTLIVMYDVENGFAREEAL